MEDTREIKVIRAGFSWEPKEIEEDRTRIRDQHIQLCVRDKSCITMLERVKISSE